MKNGGTSLRWLIIHVTRWDNEQKKRKRKVKFSFFASKCVSEWGFDWCNDSHMLMDDHRLVLIRNTDTGCYQDRGLDVCLCAYVCVCVCLSITPQWFFMRRGNSWCLLVIWLCVVSYWLYYFPTLYQTILNPFPKAVVNLSHSLHTWVL